MYSRRQLQDIQILEIPELGQAQKMRLSFKVLWSDLLKMATVEKYINELNKFKNQFRKVRVYVFLMSVCMRGVYILN